MASHRSVLVAGLLWLTTVGAFQGPGCIARGPITKGVGFCARTSSVRRPERRESVDRHSHSHRRIFDPLGAEATDNDDQTEEQQPVSESTAIVVSEHPDTGGPLKRCFRRVARFFGAGKEKPNLKALGLYALLSYGFVSNASYSICIGLAWFTASKKSGLSPLAPDQWPVFLVSYAAFFAINNVLRVPRFALSVSLAPTFDRFIAFLMKKSGRGKTFATGLCVFLVNVLGTLTLIATGILLASLFSGVPFWPVAAA